MPRSSDDKIIESIRLYRETLKETRALYIESGELVRGSYGWLTGGDDADAASIASQMDDLHQGFLMKVFAAVVPNTKARNIEQRQLGRVLLEHIWGKSVMGSQLHEAVDWLIDKAIAMGSGLLEAGKAAIAKLKDWWKAKKEFKAQNGEKHSLYFKGSGTNATLMIASKKQPFTDFINMITLPPFSQQSW